MACLIVLPPCPLAAAVLLTLFVTLVCYLVFGIYFVIVTVVVIVVAIVIVAAAAVDDDDDDDDDDGCSIYLSCASLIWAIMASSSCKIVKASSNICKILMFV